MVDFIAFLVVMGIVVFPWVIGYLVLGPIH